MMLRCTCSFFLVKLTLFDFFLQLFPLGRVLLGFVNPSASPMQTYIELIITPNRTASDPTAESIATRILTEGPKPGSALNLQIASMQQPPVPGYTLLDPMHLPTVTVRYLCVYSPMPMTVLDVNAVMATCPAASVPPTPTAAPFATPAVLVDGIVNLPPVLGTNQTLLMTIFVEVGLLLFEIVWRVFNGI